jgi:peptidoglycan/LPS O-acetylase OafA/YrhL
MPSKTRLFEFDALRALAIVLIVLSHLNAYVTDPAFVQMFRVINYGFPLFLFGLSLFFFVSGFTLYYNSAVVSNRKDAMGFLKKRVVRIYPLYWGAIATFFVLGIGDWPNRSSVIIQICGAQGLLAPRFMESVTLWFIGVILLYYLLYIVFAGLSYNSKYMFSAILGFLFFFAILRAAFNIVDFRFFLYYGIFIAGIIACKYNLLYARDAKSSSTIAATLLFFIALLAVASITHFTARLYVFNGLQIGDTPVLASTALTIAFANALAFLFIYSSFNIARLSLPSVGKTARKLIYAIAFSSYCVYLFHVQVLTLFASALNETMLAASEKDVIILVCGVTLIFLLCYAIQAGENNIVRKVAAYRHKKRGPYNTTE